MLSKMLMLYCTLVLRGGFANAIFWLKISEKHSGVEAETSDPQSKEPGFESWAVMSN